MERRVETHINPTLVRLLEKFQLAKQFVRGRGHYLFDRDGREYLDFTAQYGALPFGYNPHDLWQILRRAQTEELPSLVQPSLPVAALELADLLACHAPPGLTITTFAQSGAEAIEAAIKLARSSTKKPKILSTVNGFHGKTLGALSATGRPRYQKPFGAPVPDFETVPFNDLDALEITLRKGHESIAAFIVEPVQAEAGVRLAAPGYLKRTEDLCRKHGVLLIVDEIQTGLGRVGSLWACDVEDVRPDIMTIGKALGGGLFPLSACLCTEAVWNDEFGRLHSSTFANNNLSCAVGQAVMHRLLDEDRAMIRRTAEAGQRLLDRCLALQRAFPKVVKDVRGSGLLVAIEFWEVEASESFHMALVSRIGALPVLIAGYLLNVETIRVLPFLNDQISIRLEPSLTIEDVEIDRATEALRRVCEILDCKDYALLHEYLVVNRPPRRSPAPCQRISYPAPPVVEHPQSVAGRFAFLIHYTDLEDMLVDVPSLKRFPRDIHERLWEWCKERTEVADVFYLPMFSSPTGALCQGWLIVVPLTSEELLSSPRTEVLPVLLDALGKAKELGAEIVGLGAFTSVASRAGIDLTGHHIAVTTGNSLTVAFALEGLLQAARMRGIDVQRAMIAVVGANGSVGRACARLLLSHGSALMLVGNPENPEASMRRLTALMNDLRQECSSAELTATLNLTETLRCADLVVVASSSLDTIIFPEQLKTGAVVCDLTRPANVSPQVLQERPDVLVFDGGYARLPHPVRFGTNFGLPPGVTFACLAETMVLALEKDFRDTSIGTLDPAEVQRLGGLARKHGVQVGPLYVNDREISLEEISALNRTIHN